MGFRDSVVGRLVDPPHAVMARQFVSQSPTGLVAVVVGLVVVGFGYGFAFAPALGDVRPFLRGLASVQASFVGVVFAVIILGIQLIESRHSARMSFLFYAHPVFVITLAVIVVSIGLDLFLVAAVQDPVASATATASASGETATGGRVTTSPLETGGVYAAVGLALGNVLLFLTFLTTALSLNAPEETLDAFGDWVTPELCVAFLRAEDYGTDRHHPLFPLYRTATKAIDDSDHETAVAAVEQYCELVDDTVDLTVREEALAAAPGEQISAMFDPILVRYGPQLAARAAANGEFEVTASVVSCVVSAGEQGLDSEYGNLDGRALRGLRTLSEEASDDDPLADELRDGLGSLLTATARKSPSRFRLLLVEAEQLRDDWRLASPATADGHALRGYVSALVESHRALLDAVADGTAPENLDRVATRPGPASSPTVRALLACRRELCTVTATAVERAAEDERRVPSGVLDCWQTACVDADQRGLHGYATTLCRALVVFAYAAPLAADDNDQRWLAALAQVGRDADSELLQAAFDAVERDGSDGGIPAEGVGIDGYTPIDGHDAFPGRLRWLEASTVGQP